MMRPWHRSRIRHEIKAARASIAELLALSGATDGPSRYGSLPCEGGACKLHVIASRGRSVAAVNHLATRIVPPVLKDPSRWLFLIETSAPCPGTRRLDQYALATAIAHRLRIPAPPHPFAAIYQQEVLQVALDHGLPLGVTSDDLYGALCYDCLPKRRNCEPVQKGLESAKIHEALHPRREAIRLLHDFQWPIDTNRLTEVVTHVLNRIETESPWMLDEFYDHKIRPLLAHHAQTLNRQRLKQWLEETPAHASVLVMMDDHHLPLRLPD